MVHKTDGGHEGSWSTSEEVHLWGFQAEQAWTMRTIRSWTLQAGQAWTAERAHYKTVGAGQAWASGKDRL